MPPPRRIVETADDDPIVAGSCCACAVTVEVLGWATTAAAAEDTDNEGDCDVVVGCVVGKGARVRIGRTTLAVVVANVGGDASPDPVAGAGMLAGFKTGIPPPSLLMKYSGKFRY